MKVWETIAIAEYCAEQAPGLWPADPARRAHARAIAAEVLAAAGGLWIEGLARAAAAGG